ncbi:probable nucleoporin Nup54 [Plutella xylostella]|uniref:probable nucleoporin Nup54 n=1 Tax=Plutella xylostella TaxID=51655 RepID=UPI00203315F6|nr:probable nucleoporin Nup54 [Plutella xylostella]
MSFSFGSTANTQNNSFGSAAKPSFGFGSTNTATTSQAGFSGFGATTASTSSGFSGFGANTSTAAPFGTLGAPAASSAPSLFGGGGFGTTAAKPTTGFGTSGGFGTSTFGAAAPFGGTSTFGSTAPAFGGTNTLGANTLGGNTLGANTFGGGSTFGAGSAFGSSFGAKPAATGFGGFGTGLGTTNTFGQQPQQQQQQQQAGPASAHEALVAAVFNCSVFGDERDQTLAKWNLIQAQWGTGKAYYSQTAPPLELTEQNPLCRFKAVGYTKLGARGEKDGHVALVFNQPEQSIKTNQQQLTTSLSSLLGNKPNLVVNVESVKAMSDSKTQVVIYVVDNNAGGTHVSSTELANFLSGGARAALAGAGCASVTAVTRPTPQMLAQYLQTPPHGIDMRLWKQAQADNPDPENYIPVPIIGFSEIKFRARCQAEQAALQAGYLKQAREQLDALRARRAGAAARLASLAAAHHAARHTLLQVIAQKEVSGRVGASLTAEEEAARARLHELATTLAAPPVNNGRLNELLCAVRLQRSASAGGPQERYHLDPGAQEDLKQFLVLQQRGMAHLMETARKDLAALGTIADGMAAIVRA